MIISPALPRAFYVFSIEITRYFEHNNLSNNNLNYYIRIPLTLKQGRFPLGTVLLIQYSFVEPFLPGGNNASLTADPPY